MTPHSFRQTWSRRIAALVSALIAAATMAAPAAGAATPAKPFDFNGDGYPDLPIGSQESIGSARYAGALNVLYGSSDGVTAAGDQLLTQNSDGLAEQAQDRDAFGLAQTSGDFNRDGYADLAVSAYLEDVDDAINAGVVHVLYGSSTGLSSAGSQLWKQGADGLGGIAQDFDLFGATLAQGDFDGDGFADLAVGAPQEAVGSVSWAGAVQVLRGSAAGLTAAGSQTWTQDSPGVADQPEYRRAPDYSYPDAFGSSLATGDVDNDGFADLAIGVRGETVEGSCTDATQLCSQPAYGAGAVHVLYGSAAGLTAIDSEFWHQNTPGVRGTAWARSNVDDELEAGEGLGSALGLADFNGDGYSDVAAGAPLDDVVASDGRTACERRCDEGSVNVLYGSRGGLTMAGDDYWHLGTPGIDGEHGGLFGDALGAGDVDGDGDDDLAVGIPFLNVAGRHQAGGVLVIRGRSDGLHEKNDKLWTQETPDVVDAADHEEHFGDSVVVRQLGAGTRPELVIGAPGEEVGGKERAGRVHVLYGRRTGPSADGDEAWSRATRGVKGDPGRWEAFASVGT